MHRLIFHFEPEEGIGARLHWIIHGVHHDHPNDPLRLVMPPSVSIPLALGFWGLFVLALGTPWAHVFTAGFLAGYLAYDMTHYHVHHHRPRTRLGKLMRELHMRHHFQDDTQGLRRERPVLGLRVRHAAAPPRRRLAAAPFEPPGATRVFAGCSDRCRRESQRHHASPGPSAARRPGCVRGSGRGHAAPGAFDRSFGGDGRVELTIPGESTWTRGARRAARREDRRGGDLRWHAVRRALPRRRRAGPELRVRGYRARDGRPAAWRPRSDDAIRPAAYC